MAMKIRAALVMMALTLPGVGHAESLKVLPKAGLWQQDVKVLVNGEDIMAKAAAAQQQMLDKLPPTQRAAMEQQLAASGALGSQKQCVTAADIQKMAAQTEWTDEQCKYRKLRETAATVEFSARCDAAQGYAGDLKGTMTVVDAEHWNMVMDGSGTLSAAGAGAQAMTQHSEIKARWLGADCGGIAAH